jgi:hypothetical protein
MTWLKKKCVVVSVALLKVGMASVHLEVIYCHNDVLVSINGWRIASHEVYAPFVEGFSGDDWM